MLAFLLLPINFWSILALIFLTFMIFRFYKVTKKINSLAGWAQFSAVVTLYLLCFGMFGLRLGVENGTYPLNSPPHRIWTLVTTGRLY